MCKKLIYSFSFVLVLAVIAPQSWAQVAFEQIEEDGLLVFETEHFHEYVPQGGFEWFLVSDPTASGGEAMQNSVVGDNIANMPDAINGSPRIDFYCNFIFTGTHYIWARCNTGSNGGNSFHFGIDFVANTTTDRMQWPNTWATWDWTSEQRDSTDPASIDISEAGEHTVNLYMREGGAIVDKIVITTNPDFIPSDDGPAETLGNPDLAKDPYPLDEATDVPHDVVLSWLPGETAVTHAVYIGETLEDVNDAGIVSPLLVSPAQIATTYDHPDLLKFGQIYYWRIDEVAADGTVYKGDVWSFTVEPIAYPIENIITNASSSNTADEGPENTTNGSGLNGNLHSTVLTDMWFTATGEPAPAWIQYDFDKAYKLHEMLVWNYNGPSFLTAIGLKDVVVEYSSDGTDLVQIDSVNEFARASGLDDYPPNTTVPLDGILAKSVKISASSNWSGGFSDQFGLSEVQILQIPVNAREPFPVSGATDVDVDVILGWRAGREAASHDVYISDDPNALTLADSVDQPSFDTTSQTLALGQTYHWRIDEVNDAETPKTWQGELWNFTTQEYIVVDDFESYNTTDRQIWEIWLDGLGFGTAGTPNYNPGNGTGSAIGDENSPSYMEETIVHSGSKSMPVAYNNSTATKSEVIVQTSNLPIGGDWTKGAPETLVLWFYGNPANAATERMYVKVNGEKVDYPGAAEDITRPIWTQWNIDLTALGISLSNVPQMTIGFERTGAFGGSGKVLIDDIRLYRSAPSMASEEIWLEAEAATTQGPSWRLYDDTGASAGRYIGSEDGDGDDNGDPPGDEWHATYDFTVSGGVYKIMARIITSPGNSFWVRISDATSPQITRDDGWVNTNPMDEANTWHWDEIHNDQQNDNVVYFTLSAGQHTLEIAKREDGAMLDAVLITDDVY